MLNLIKLELKRVSLKSHFIGLLAANIVIALLSAFTSSLLNAGGGVAVTGLPPAQLDTLTLAIMLVRAALIVWEAVLISVFVVEEYRNKTINLLFTYPVQCCKQSSKMVQISPESIPVLRQVFATKYTSGKS